MRRPFLIASLLLLPIACDPDGAAASNDALNSSSDDDAADGGDESGPSSDPGPEPSSPPSTEPVPAISTCGPGTSLRAIASTELAVAFARIETDDLGRIYLGSTIGVTIYDEQLARLASADLPALRLSPVPEGGAWISSGSSSLLRIDVDATLELEIELTPELQQPTPSFHALPGGGVLVGYGWHPGPVFTDDFYGEMRIHRFDAAGNTEAVLSRQTYYDQYVPNHMVVDGGGRVYFEQGGQRLIAEADLETVTTVSGASSGTRQQVAFPGGGVVRLGDVDGLETDAIERLDEQGLPIWTVPVGHGAWGMALDDAGRVFFHTHDGVASISPDGELDFQQDVMLEGMTIGAGGDLFALVAGGRGLVRLRCE